MWQTCKTKKERVERIRELLKSNDKAVMRGVVAIYKRQTEEEKCYESTREENGVGFSAFDATFLTSIAKQVIAGYQLSPKQLAIARNKILRYTRQLAEIAAEREQKSN